MPKFDLKAHEERMRAKIQQRTQPSPEDKLKGLAPPVAEKIKEIARRMKGTYPR